MPLHMQHLILPLCRMERLISKYVSLSKEDPEKSESWTQLSKDEWTQLYRLYEKKDDVVEDSIIAIAQIEGVTAGEMVEIFHSQELKLKWDQSIDCSDWLEDKNEHCAVYHQVQKRIWPAAQRDFVYESHKERLGEGEHPDWIVCNVSCDHPKAPSDKYCRAKVEIVFYCQTIVTGDPYDRENVKCKIFYSSQIDPGGWVPVSAVKAAATREYPKFIKNLGTFAQEHVKDQKIKF